jgi:hypothetical protein
MAILETAISFQGDPLIERTFYSTDDVLDKNIRNALLQAITGLAQEAFNDAIQSFTLGDYSIVLFSHEVAEPINPINKHPLMMYCIVEKNTDEKAIKQCMQDALVQFLNRYSLNDIFEKKTKKFKDFPDRLSKIFKDLILKSEDRFKSLF